MSRVVPEVRHAGNSAHHRLTDVSTRQDPRPSDDTVARRGDRTQDAAIFIRWCVENILLDPININLAIHRKLQICPGKHETGADMNEITFWAFSVRKLPLLPSRKSAMLNQKRFGRKISIPSTMEIKRDLMDMAHADTIVKSFKSRGLTRHEFGEVVSGLVADGLLSLERAQVLTLRFERTDPQSPSLVDDRDAR